MPAGLFMIGAASRMAASASHAQSTGERASRLASEVRSQNEAIIRDTERLFMITEALWTILKEQHGYTDEDLIHRVEDIDLRDGKLDGKVARKPSPPCAQCNRPIIGRHAVCLYCGARTPRGPFDR